MALAISQTACVDTSGTGDDPCSESAMPCSEEDVGMGLDAARVDSALIDSAFGDSPSGDSFAIDCTIADSTIDDSTVSDSALGDSLAEVLDVGDARDATEAGDVEDSKDAADTFDTPADSGLSSDPFMVRCREKTSCGLSEGDVCCTPKPDGGPASPWRCWDSSTCVAGTGMACDEAADCPDAKVCCAASTTATMSSCKTSCGSDTRLCMTNAECGAGKSCIAFSHVSGATLGACTP